MLNNRVLKNIKSRSGNTKKELDYVVLKFILKQSLLAKKDNEAKKRCEITNSLLAKYSAINSRVSAKNLCIITGKARSVYRFCKLSRMELKRYSGFGLLNGLKPSS